MKIFLVLSLLLISGCQTVYKDRLVEVPMPIYEQPPEPGEIEDLDLPIYKLEKGASGPDIVKAFWASIVILEAARDASKEAVKPFKKEDPK